MAESSASKTGLFARLAASATEPTSSTTTTANTTRSTSSSSMLWIITGASRGFGRAIAVTVSQQQQLEHLHLILVARSLEQLEALKQEIQSTDHNKSIHITCHQADLSDLDQLDSNFEQIFEHVALTQFDDICFVNNHGSLGWLGPGADTPSLAELQSTVNLNITSCLWLSSRFAKVGLISQEARVQQNMPRINMTLVNVSSLLAKKPFATMGVYAAGKAARDQYHATLALETAGQLQVLNYAPGPLQTDMVTAIRQAPLLDKDLKPAFAKPVLQPGQSARKLVRLVLQGSYESGAHIDYYDLPDLEEEKK